MFHTIEVRLYVPWGLLCLFRSRYDWHRPPQAPTLGDPVTPRFLRLSRRYISYWRLLPQALAFTPPVFISAHGPRPEAQPLLIFHRTTRWHKAFVGEADSFKDTGWGGGGNEGRILITAMQTSSSCTLGVSILKMPFWSPHHRMLPSLLPSTPGSYSFVPSSIFCSLIPPFSDSLSPISPSPL